MNKIKVHNQHIQLTNEARGDHLTNRCITTDVRQKGFYLKAWRAECEFDIDYKGSETVNISTVNAFSGSSLEIDIILPSKPETNIFSYDITTKNLSFYYQDHLTEKEIEDGVTCDPNVGGSYAVYHTTKRGNYTKANGDELNYGTGKVCHIYRPKAIDDKGNEVWCALEIADGKLSVIIPQGFLDKATYPITIDPEFGFTTNGSKERTMGSSDTEANIEDTYTATSGDTITELHLWARVYSGTKTLGLGVYDVSGGVPTNLLIGNQEISVSSTTPVDNEVTGLSTSMVDSTEYCIAMGPPSDTVRYRYDDSTGALSRDTGATFPDPFVEASTSDRRISLYAVYTEGGGETDTVTIESDATVKTTETVTIESACHVSKTDTTTIGSDSHVSKLDTTTIDSDGHISKLDTVTIDSGGHVTKSDNVSLNSDAEIQAGVVTDTVTIGSSGHVTKSDTTTIDSDAVVTTIITDTVTIDSNGHISKSDEVTIDSDAQVTVNETVTIGSDGLVVVSETVTITSDSQIRGLTTITSNMQVGVSRTNPKIIDESIGYNNKVTNENDGYPNKAIDENFDYPNKVIEENYGEYTS